MNTVANYLGQMSVATAGNLVKTKVQEEGGKRRKLELGYLPRYSLDCHALVIANGWPSWSFGLQGLGFKDITTKLIDPSLGLLSEFRCTDLGHSCLREGLNEWKNARDAEFIVFIQGNHAFFENTIKSYPWLEAASMIYLCSDPTYHCAECSRISHQSVGGVTSGVWSYFMQRLPHVVIKPTKVIRSLSDIINPVESLDSSTDKQSNSTPVLGGNDSIPFGTKNVWVEAPWVL